MACRPASAAIFLAPLVLVLPLASKTQEKPAANGQPKPATRPASRPTMIVVRYTDERLAELAVAGESLRLNTAYGKLLIPFAKIVSVDFATRISDEDAHRASAAIVRLGSPRYRVRSAAEAELLKMREKAAPALHQAIHSSELEVGLRAQRLLERLSGLVAADQLEFRPQDVVRTTDSRIAGRIEGLTFKAYPLPFGKRPEQVVSIMGVRSLAVGADPRTINAAPDPGTVQAFQGQIGKTYWFKVTGAVGGTIWGAKVYTSDSPLATTAVHAGILKVGQSGVVHVKIVMPLANYAGTTQNGVVSQPYGAWPGAYQFIK
jgi:hypothetical protein